MYRFDPKATKQIMQDEIGNGAVCITTCLSGDRDCGSVIYENGILSEGLDFNDDCIFPSAKHQIPTLVVEYDDGYYKDFHPCIQDKEWRVTLREKPKDGAVVYTKIDDEMGVRNERDLVYENKLWWLRDGSMYVYYTPTHWAYK